MHSNNFEQAFGDFLERREYDQAENALFSIVRIAFLAGWNAAGGDAPPPQKVFRLVHKEISELHEIESDLQPAILQSIQDDISTDTDLN